MCIRDSSRGHAVKVAETAGNILDKLGYNQHKIELAKIAGYMHDMGNCVNRVDHAHSSAIMAFQILRDLKVPDEDLSLIHILRNQDYLHHQKKR